MAQPTWVTPAGNFGTYTEGLPLSYTFVATVSTPGQTLVYNILNGVFPAATVPFTLNSSTGILTGTPEQVAEELEYEFTIRVSEYNGLIFVGSTDRTFSFNVVGVTPPTFITPPGPLYPGPTYLPDSTWNPYQILVDNPDPQTTAVVRLIAGSLPPGLEINSSGLIRGYADPSNTNYNFKLQVESGSGTATSDYSIQVVQQLAANRAPAILNSRPLSYTISINDPNAPYYCGSDGYLGVYSQDNYFIWRVVGTSFGSGTLSYSRGGSLPPGLTDNVSYSSNNISATPTTGGSGYSPGDILYIPGALLGGVNGSNDLYFTVATTSSGGVVTSVTGFSGLNVESGIAYYGIAATTATGTGAGAVFNIQKINPSWILGTIQITPTLVATYTFTYTPFNTTNGQVGTPITFTMDVVAQTAGVPFNPSITWNTPDDLGTINNGQISALVVEAENPGGLPLTYTLSSGSLPPELTLQADGTITGKVAWETQTGVSPQGSSYPYTFTVTAQNLTYPVNVTSSKTFTLTVVQEFSQPYDSLYIRSYLDVPDRQLLDTLITDPDIIPQQWLYRPMDQYFGKATDVVYQHMWGVPSSTISAYIAAVSKNYYRRNLTLGPVRTAEARNSAGELVYEVVYSEIVDDLVNADGVSVSKEVVWPVPVGGSTITVYPASLPNMRQQIVDTIGQDTSSKLLPLWMSGQQGNGGILGFVPAWVICYVKPGYSAAVKNNIVSPFTGTFTVIATEATTSTVIVATTALFYPGMRVMFTGTGFGGITTGTPYWIESVVSNTQFTISTGLGLPPISLTNDSGNNLFMEHITWGGTLNEINFRIDRFEVDKTVTYDYNPGLSTWTPPLPSGVDSTDSHDEYVLWNNNILS